MYRGSHANAGGIFSPGTRMRVGASRLYLCMDRAHWSDTTAPGPPLQCGSSTADMVFCSPCDSPVANCIVMRAHVFVAIVGFMMGFAPGVAQIIPTGNETRSDHLVVEPPTLVCAGFQWIIAGDNNRNASVAVYYRKQGESEWRTGHPLLRIGGEQIYGHEQRWNYTTRHNFAGSIFDLEPGTHFERQLVRSDSDVVIGDTLRHAVI